MDDSQSIAMGSAGLNAGSMAAGFSADAMLRKDQKAQRRVSDLMRKRAHYFQDKNLQEAQADTNKAAFDQGNATAAQDYHDVGPSSSIGVADQRNVEHERAKRFTRIQEQRDFGQSQFQSEEDLIQAQRRSEANQRYMKMIQGMMNSGAMGAAGAAL